MNKQSKLKNNLFVIGLFFVLTLTLFITNFNRVETDFFWIVKGGEWIVQNHTIPHADIWSYTMSSYPWVFHEWLSGVFMYEVQNHIGHWFLVLLSSILATSAVLIPLEKKHIKKYWRFIIFMALYLNLYLWGFRPQTFTFFNTALVFSLLIRYIKFKKIRYLIPIPFIFVLWANLHGGFFVGLAIFFYLVFIKIFQGKFFLKKYIYYSVFNNKEKFIFSLFFLLSFLATLINPYGIHLFREVFYTFMSPLAGIGEWLPQSEFIFVFPYVIVLSLSIVVFKKLPFEWASVVYISFLSLIVQKFAPIFLVLSPYILMLAWDKFSESPGFSIVENFKKRIIIWVVFAQIIIFLLLVSFASSMNFVFPNKAVDFIRQNRMQDDRIFNNYGWGGYLIYYLPEEKVFIDGRMSAWFEKNNYFARDGYGAIVKKADKREDLIKKYNINLFLLNKDRDDKLVEYLKNNSNWQEIYSDDLAVIYKIKK
ncbi:MAG: hypothetical protein WCW17_01310 [Patescibacteria group bacterium]